MRKVLMIMYATLDGVAEFPEYLEEPAGPEAQDPMWSPRMGEIDTLLLGRRTYLNWAAYWPAKQDAPNCHPWERAFSRFANHAEKVVFSKTLESAGWANSRIVRNDVAGEVERMRMLPGGPMALGGGPKLAQSFLEKDLVDEMLLELFPSLVGRGKPLFRVDGLPDNSEDLIPIGARGRRDFTLLAATPQPTGAIFLRYVRSGPPRESTAAAEGSVARPAAPLVQLEPTG